MPKSLLAHSYEDILTIAGALVVKVKETMSVVVTSLTTIGLQGDGVVMVVPGESPETVAREILDALAS